jgi:hypothetical protein
MTSAVLEEALKKATLAWVSVGDGPALGVWCMPLDGSLIMVTGPGEQHAPGLAEASTATVRLRGDNGGLIVVAEMTVTRLAPEGDDWAEVAPQLAQKRLNAAGAFGELVTRWAANGCAIVRLTPSDQNTTAPHLPATSGAAAPRETPARVETKRPFRLHRLRKS